MREFSGPGGQVDHRATRAEAKSRGQEGDRSRRVAWAAALVRRDRAGVAGAGREILARVPQ
jgi:hypothetical protein